MNAIRVFLVWVLITPCLYTGISDSSRWSKSKCDSVIEKSTASGESKLRARSSATAIWITKPVAFAIGRKIQLSEKLENERIYQVANSIHSSETYTFVVFIETDPTPYSYLAFKAKAPDSIFLEDEDESNYVRVGHIEACPFDPKQAFGRTSAECLLIRFPRIQNDGAPLIKNPGRTMRFHLQNSKELIEIEFKLSKFGLKSITDF